MKKLNLRLDALKVESFRVSSREGRLGTVQAHADMVRGETGVTQCLTGPCDCYLTDPSCEVVCSE